LTMHRKPLYRLEVAMIKSNTTPGPKKTQAA